MGNASQQKASRQSAGPKDLGSRSTEQKSAGTEYRSQRAKGHTAATHSKGPGSAWPEGGGQPQVGTERQTTTAERLYGKGNTTQGRVMKGHSAKLSRRRGTAKAERECRSPNSATANSAPEAQGHEATQTEMPQRGGQGAQHGPHQRVLCQPFWSTVDNRSMVQSIGTPVQCFVQTQVILNRANSRGARLDCHAFPIDGDTKPASQYKYALTVQNL